MPIDGTRGIRRRALGSPGPSLGAGHPAARLRSAEVVSVAGSADRLGRVLDATGLPFIEIGADRLEEIDWAALQVLFVGCPGRVPREQLPRLGEWVRRGGYLVTTDRAVEHVIEPLFPGTVRSLGPRPGAGLVQVETRGSGTDPLLAGFLERDREAVWTLASTTWPIAVLDRDRVRVLVRSAEAHRRWGDDALAVAFEHGGGTVLHLVGHLEQQRCDLPRTAAAEPQAAEDRYR